MNGGVSNKGLVLAAMVFAVAMTFIDQTVVAIAIPTNAGVPETVAHRVAGSLSASTPGAGSGAGQPHAIVHDVQLAFAHSIQTIFYIMAGVMAASFLVAVRRLPRGRVETVEEPEVPVSPASAGA